jgi:hypothetical protein
VLTRRLAVDEFIAVDFLTRDPERMNEKRYGETARFSDFVREQKTMISTENITKAH